MSAAASTTPPSPIARERTLILGALLLLAAGCWAVLIWQAATMDRMSMGLTMGMGAPLFIGLWVAMMVAMMFPSAAPMILLFARSSAGRRQRGQAHVPAWVFVGAYLLIWSAAGVAAYLLAIGAEHLADHWIWLQDNAARIGGAVFIVAGAYQLSPLKRVCLSKCRSPISFVMQSWRDGYGGAFRMGLEHGLYCLGCCWLLFVILFPLGMMNVAAMAAIAALVFVEKCWPIGRQTATLAAVGLAVYGAVVLAMPAALPTAM